MRFSNSHKKAWEMDQSTSGQPFPEMIDRKAFIRRQSCIFDKVATHFVSDEVMFTGAYKRLKKIVEQRITDFERSLPLRVLDVGSGCGVLTGILLGINPEMRVTAIDISENMLHELKRRYPRVMTIHRDIIELSGPTFFDMVWFNACFGNLYDPAAALRHVASQMSYGSRLLISHPMGRKYQQQLHEKDPLTVPHLLPASEQEAINIAEGSGLKLEVFEDKSDSFLVSYGLRS